MLTRVSAGVPPMKMFGLNVITRSFASGLRGPACRYQVRGMRSLGRLLVLNREIITAR